MWMNALHIFFFQLFDFCDDDDSLIDSCDNGFDDVVILEKGKN